MMSCVCVCFFNRGRSGVGDSDLERGPFCSTVKIRNYFEVISFARKTHTHTDSRHTPATAIRVAPTISESLLTGGAHNSTSHDNRLEKNGELLEARDAHIPWARLARCRTNNLVQMYYSKTSNCLGVLVKKRVTCSTVSLPIAESTKIPNKRKRQNKIRGNTYMAFRGGSPEELCTLLPSRLCKTFLAKPIYNPIDFVGI